MRLLALLTITLCILTLALAAPTPDGKPKPKKCDKKKPKEPKPKPKPKPDTACGPPHINEGGLALVKKAEGFVDHPYWDVKQWAIGYGHSCGSDKSCSKVKQPLSEAGATKLLKGDMKVRAYKKLDSYLPAAKDKQS